jgi:ABC-2 type transport system permease protein
MTGKIARKEILEMMREGRFRIALFIVLALLLAAAAVSREYYLSIQRQHAEARQQARAMWLEMNEMNPHSAAHYGTYAFKPKYPLSLIDQGVDKYAGNSIFLEAHQRNEAQFAAAADQTGLSRFGDLTPDFLLLFILPLLIVLMGYNAFTREREQGTLRLLRSQGVSTWRLALGKWQAIFLPAALLTVALFLVAALMLSSLRDFGRLDWPALLGMIAVYLLYYAVFTSLVLMVSALARHSGVALLSALMVWIVATLVAPKGASNLAEAWYPYPTRLQFAEAVKEDIRSGLDGHNPWNEAAKQFEKETLEKYGVDSLHQLPFNFDGYLMQKGEEHEAEVYFKHYQHLREQYERQSGLYRALAFLSPFLPARFLSMALARTDYTAHWDFADAAERYRLKMVETLNMDLAENSQYGDWAYKADKNLWSKVPAFEYEPTGLREIWRRNTGNLSLLLIWLGFSFAGLYWASRTRL